MAKHTLVHHWSHINCKEWSEGGRKKENRIQKHEIKHIFFLLCTASLPSHHSRSFFPVKNQTQILSLCQFANTKLNPINYYIPSVVKGHGDTILHITEHMFLPNSTLTCFLIHQLHYGSNKNRCAV